METGSGCFLSLGALTQQIRTLEGKRKNSDSLCETEAFHQATVNTIGPFIRGKIRRVLNKTRTFRINGTFRPK